MGNGIKKVNLDSFLNNIGNNKQNEWVQKSNMNEIIDVSGHSKDDGMNYTQKDTVDKILNEHNGATVYYDGEGNAYVDATITKDGERRGFVYKVDKNGVIRETKEFELGGSSVTTTEFDSNSKKIRQVIDINRVDGVHEIIETIYNPETEIAKKSTRWEDGIKRFEAYYNSDGSYDYTKSYLKDGSCKITKYRISDNGQQSIDKTEYYDGSGNKISYKEYEEREANETK